MNKLLRHTLLIINLFFAAACNIETIQAGSEKTEKRSTASYLNLLGKSVDNKEVTDFIASNHCSSAAQYQLCKAVGVALLINLNQIVETVYLYVNNTDGFGPYQGELPFGLKFYDTMGAVEYKLKRKGAGSAGLPDSGDTPDHLHYQANYQQLGMTIIYNSPSAEDEDATIYAILVNK